MSLFLDPDEESIRGVDENNYTLSYPSTPCSQNDLFDAGNAWAAVGTSGDEYECVSQPMAWPSEHTFAFPSTQISTESMLVDPSLTAFVDTSMESSGPLSTGILMPWATQRQNIRHDSLIQNCYPQSAFLPSQAITSWHSFPNGLACFRPAYELSPGRSEYSVSSTQNSGVVSSSPYAYSEGCCPARHSPIIKVEEDHTRPGPRLHSVSRNSSPRTQSTHVSPGDIFYPPDIQVDDQPTTPPVALVKCEEDVKPVLCPMSSGEHQALSTEETRQVIAENRRKRGFTTPRNAVCSCDQCGKLFQRTSNLKAHLDTHKPDREQPWVCQHHGCTRRFVRKTDMSRHQESVS